MVTTAPLGKMVIELGLDSSDFGKSLQSSKREVRYWSNDMRASMRAADMAGNTLGKFEARHNGLTKVIEAQRKTVDRLKQSYDNSFVDGKPTAQTEKLAAQLRNAESQLINYNKQLVNNAGEMAKWKVENEGITGSLNKFGETLTKRGDQMAKFGDSMTKRVTLPIVAGVGAVVKAAMDWESAWAGVQKTNDEVVDANGNIVYSYEQLEGELRALTKELPATHAEIAGVAEAAGQLGIQTESVASFTKTMIDLGESTNLSSEQAATSLARLANITGMSQNDFDRLGSSIVEVGNNFATTESEITELAMRLAGAGSQIGLTEADIIGLAGALSSVGIEAQAGGTALSKTMINMAVAAETGYQQMLDLEKATGLTRRELELLANHDGKAFKEMAASLGMTTTEMNKVIKAGNNLEDFAAIANMTAGEFKQAFEEDAVGALGAFIEGLGAAEEKGTSAIQLLDDMGISEVRLRDSLLRAGNASELFADSVKMSNEAFEENTALSTEANIRYETLESQLGMLRNEVYDTAIEFGGPFVQAIRDGITVSRPFLERLSEMAKAFTDMDPEMQQTIIRTLAITAAIGPLMSVTGRLASGLGGLTTKTIGFMGVLAQKKTVADFTKQMMTGSGEIVNWGNAASTAAGAKGMGAMTGAIGTFSSVAWPLVGAGGLLAVGYGAWKLWGEEAWNSAQRTKEWGTDVGEVTHEALTDIQGYSQSAVGEFGLMEQGFSTNVTSMIDNFQQMGESIENDLLRQVEAFTESINMLPEEIRDAAQEIVNEAIESREETLQIVQENNERVAEIRKRAADNNRETTIAEANIIKGLMEESAAEYLRITIEDADARQQVLDALTGNVEQASKDQATAWVQSLGEQRQLTKQEYTNQLNDYKEYLEEQGILNTEEGQRLVELFEQSRDASTEAIDAQIALIAEKYPELTEEIYFANGQLIKAMGEAGSAAISSNEQILNNATKLSRQMAENAEANAEQIGWVADVSKSKAAEWNDLVFDVHTGEVKTNVREVVIEGTKSAEDWHNISYQLKHADLNSNAKSIIGEAAIVNGWWDGMEWDYKSAILEDEFSETIYKALEESGKWDEMSLEEKTAIVYSNTPETMIETLAHLDLWEEYIVHAKDIEADNFSFMSSIRDSEEKLNVWNSIDPATKEILGENYDLMQAIFESETYFNVFKSLPDEEKLLLADNSDLLFAISKSEESYNRWRGLPEEEKHLIGNNADILSSILTSEKEYNRWLNLPEEDKKLLGDNTDLIRKLVTSEREYQEWLNLPEYEKRLLVDNQRAMSPTEDAIDMLTNYRRFEPGPKSLIVTTNASSTEQVLQRARNEWNRIRSGTRTLTLRYQTVGNPHAGGAYATGLAKGTNYHKGGPAIVNDQRGSKFRELITYPDGRSFVPHGRNVLLDLPKGSKVFRASLTEKLLPGIPQYANGVGIPSDATVIQNINRVNSATQSKPVQINNNFGQLESLLRQMLNVISRLQPKIDINVENWGETDPRTINENIEFLTQINERGNLQ